MKEININGAVMKCYPLCTAQRLHFSTIRYAPPQLLCIGTGLYVKQDVDFNLLKQAVYKSYKKFDSMRLRFHKDEDGEVYQYVVPSEDRDIEFRDFSAWSEDDVTEEMKRWTAVPFERFDSPMNKIVMVRMPGGYCGTYMKVDHMTMDSSAIVGFSRCVLETYSIMRYGIDIKEAPVKPFIPQLEKDLAYEADSPALKRDEEFWQGEMNKPEPIYTDFSGQGKLLTERRENKNPKQRYLTRRSSSPAASISVYQLEKDASMRLMKFCELYNVSMASLLLMGMRTVLSKFNDDEKDVSVRTAVARRGTLSEKYSGGTRVHFYSVRTVMEPEMTFLEGIRMIQTEQSKIFRHANYDPFKNLIARSQHWSGNPGASYESITLTYQPLTITKDTPEMPKDIPYKSVWYTNGVAAQPLYLTVMHRPEDNGINFYFEYQKECVTEKEMEYFYYYLCRVLFRGIENEERTIGEIMEMI